MRASQPRLRAGAAEARPARPADPARAARDPLRNPVMRPATSSTTTGPHGKSLPVDDLGVDGRLITVPFGSPGSGPMLIEPLDGA